MLIGIRVLVVVLLIVWALDHGKALPPAIIYSIISSGFLLALAVSGHGVTIKAALTETAIDFGASFGLFWLIANTSGFIGFLVCAATVVFLGGVAQFLTQVLGR